MITIPPGPWHGKNCACLPGTHASKCATATAEFQPPTLADVAALVDPDAARTAIAIIMAVLGGQQSWTSETIEWVAAAARQAFPAGLPSVFDQDDAAVEYWETLA